jgi:hypothetical protein
MLRRLLLALMTALIVARPLVLGEDPGLLDRLSNAWSLLLSLLWFVAAVGWAVWRAWSGQTTWRGSGVEAGLFGVAALIWLSAVAAAHYKHPALLVASEWLVLLCAFCLVRQLARTPAEDRGLLAALLASAVSLSAFAVYQYTVEFPQIRRAYGSNLDALLDAMAAKNIVANPQLLQRRLFENNVFATYSHPNSFAGFLALLLPPAIAWTCSGRRASFFLAAAATLLIGLALWLTHSRGAILGSLLVGVAVLAAYGRRFLAAHKIAFLTGLAIVAAIAFFLSRTELAVGGMAKFWQSSAKRNDYWIATWNLIRDHPWLGVGPGNFGRLYPSYMLPRAFEKVKDPHNFILEMWSTAGLFAAITLMITFGVLFRQAWTTRRSLSSADAGEPPVPWTRWEFYLGGMLGLILGFVLRAMDQSPDEILLEGAYSFCRAIVWFAAFALFYSIPWFGPSRIVALLAGIAALLLNLLVSGGIGMPSVAQPLWIMAALTLNSLGPFAPSPDSTFSPRGNGGEGRVRPRPASWLLRMLPLPLLSGLGLAYVLLLFCPAVGCGDALAQARHYYADWPHVRSILDYDKCYVAGLFASGTAEPLHPLPMLALRPDELAKQASARVRFVNHYLLEILGPLEHAVVADPGNASAWLELAEWYAEQAKINSESNFTKAIQCAEQARLLDPDNKEPYLFKGRLYRFLAERFKQHEKADYGRAAAAIRAAVQRDPTDARLRYQLAETLFLADLPVDGRYHAKIAQELDDQATQPERELTDVQRKQIRAWLAGTD